MRLKERIRVERERRTFPVFQAGVEITFLFESSDSWSFKREKQNAVYTVRLEPWRSN